MTSAVGVSSACSLTVALTGTLGFLVTGSAQTNLPGWTTGYIYWPALLAVMVTSPLFASLGAHLAHRLPVASLQRGFALLLLLAGLKMLIA